ncbi:hypothetical protein N0V88_002822 [Collariella sp. IMI 366227]|nr:hypothetical protein N0V88_002822 [Collariella sp. IMI 366227]
MLDNGDACSIETNPFNRFVLADELVAHYQKIREERTDGVYMTSRVWPPSNPIALEQTSRRISQEPPNTAVYSPYGFTPGLNYLYKKLPSHSLTPGAAPFSLRYTSGGHYATINVSVLHPPRKQSFSGPLPRPSCERRSSFSYIITTRA